MSENILEKIIKKKIIKINNLKKTLALESLKDIIDQNDTFLNFLGFYYLYQSKLH